MQFKEHSHVYDAHERNLGRITRIVMDPVTDKVTHVVVRKGMIFTEDKVIPIEYFRSASPERADLRDDVGDLDALPVFEESHYVPAGYSEDDLPDTSMAGRVPPYLYWYPPMTISTQHTIGYYGVPSFDAPQEDDYQYRHYVKSTTQNIPDDTVAVKEGAEVISADGKHVGDIEEIQVDATSDYATHVLISKGLFLKDRKWVPTLWFRTVEDDRVYLAVTSSLLKTLPDVETA